MIVTNKTAHHSGTTEPTDEVGKVQRAAVAAAAAAAGATQHLAAIQALAGDAPMVVCIVG